MINSGDPVTAIAGAQWRKARASGQQGNCLEVADLPKGSRALRDSKNPAGPALVFSASEWSCFLDGAKNGEFDV